MEKICGPCGQSKPLTKFYKSKTTKDGLYTYCKDCANRKVSVFNEQRRRRVIELLGGMCVCCFETAYEFLAIDHVYNDGSEERKTLTPQALVAHILKRGTSARHQILCHNCNLAKAYHGECPHAKARTDWLIERRERAQQILDAKHIENTELI